MTAFGGSAGNSRLRQNLGWTEEFHWNVQGRLTEEGRIVSGRGRGGSVRLAQAEAVEELIAEPAANLPVKIFAAEHDLYRPIKEAMQRAWINRFALDDAMIEETHSRGLKDTSGTFTRPDITVVGIRRYVYLPKRLEILTFEITPKDAVTIMGVLEAVSHREASHRAFVVHAASRQVFDEGRESDRILELAQKFGVGVILVEDPHDVETWDILVDAVRHEPDPARLDRFLNDRPGDGMKKQLSKWKE